MLPLHNCNYLSVLRLLYSKEDKARPSTRKTFVAILAGAGFDKIEVINNPFEKLYS